MGSDLGGRLPAFNIIGGSRFRRLASVRCGRLTGVAVSLAHVVESWDDGSGQARARSSAVAR
jgi:hypothetical protein